MILHLILFAILFYLFYLLLTKAFEEVGFKKWESMLIVFSCIIFEGINIPLFRKDSWIVGINVGGALLPAFISLYLILSRKIFMRSLLGIAIVSFVAYNFTHVSMEGVTAPFPYWLFPPITASLYSIIASMEKRKAAPIAYSSGTIGVLIGADLFHLRELLEIKVNKLTEANIGGAAIFDMVFLTGIIAVIIDAFLYGKEKKEKG